MIIWLRHNENQYKEKNEINIVISVFISFKNNQSMNVKRIHRKTCVSENGNQKIDDIESFLYEKSDQLKDDDLIPEGKEELIKNFIVDMASTTYENFVGYKWEDGQKKELIVSSIFLLLNLIVLVASIHLGTENYTNTVYNYLYYLLIIILMVNIVVLTRTIFQRCIPKFIKLEGKETYRKRELEIRRKYHFLPRKTQMIYMYRKLRHEGVLEENETLETFLIVKKMRSESGVMVVSVIMPPDTFSCAYDCYYCPNDPRYSRSYYHGEPTVMRGERNGFSALQQFRERAISYLMNGHPIDKCEVIILGGTFSCYQPKVAEEFICALYYASNTLFDKKDSLRPMLSIEEEIKLNENAVCKIIGMTIETRPDKITKYELRRFRRYGVTRIQMGLQHTDDEILEKMNRQCSQKEHIRAIQLAKDEGFKVDIHIMPDLPFSTIEKDYEMFNILFTDPRYRADQWKIYPTNVLEFTKIKEWYEAGEYKPYAESNFEGFMDLLVYVMKNLPPYVRVNRVQRDFPGHYIEGGNKLTNLRQVLDDKLKECEITSKDIRSMEIRGNEFDPKRVRLVRYDYDSSDGKEIFLSMKSCTCKFCYHYERFKMKQTIYRLFGKEIYYEGCGNENRIYGFLRLRLSENAGKESFPVLQKKGLIRELHVYGKVKSTYSTKEKSKSQHQGYGSQLLEIAEKITKSESECDGMAVISGVGVRNYYRKKGYEIEENQIGDFLIKRFYSEISKKNE